MTESSDTEQAMAFPWYDSSWLEEYLEARAILERVAPEKLSVFDDAIEASVRDILAAVRLHGDEALLELTERFDGVRPEALRVPVRQLDAALEALKSHPRTDQRLYECLLRWMGREVFDPNAPSAPKKASAFSGEAMSPNSSTSEIIR